MKLTKMLFFLLFAVTIINAQTKTTAKDKQQNEAAKKSAISITTQDDTVSYAIGQSLSHNLKDPSMNINFGVLIEGLQDGLTGQSKISEAQMKNAMNAFNQKMMAKRTADLNAVKEKNKKAGEEFLAENKKKPGVVTLADGLQYKILVTGTGPSPKATDKVKVNYKGSLIDGRVFDSSYERNEPASFPLNQVIKGWTEALQLMHVGDKWELYIPSELGYGENGAGNMIEPNSVLIFEVELLEILPNK